MILLSREQKKQIAKKIFAEVVDEFLLEYTETDAVRDFKDQNDAEFYSHPFHVQDLLDKGIQPEFKQFSNGLAVFKVKSSEWKTGVGNKDKEYFNFIYFKDWKNFFDDVTLTFPERMMRMIKGDLGFWCTCPSFWYHYSYAAHKKGADLLEPAFQQKIAAPIKNPTELGIGCKHLALLFLQKTLMQEVIPKITDQVFKLINHKDGKDKKKISMKKPVSPSAPKSKQNQAKSGVKPVTQAAALSPEGVAIPAGNALGPGNAPGVAAPTPNPALKKIKKSP